MGLKRLINRVVGMTGYQFSRVPSVTLEIERGHYEWLRARDIRTVLDVGANTGQFATMIRKILPRATIYSFEPLADVFSELCRTGERLGNMHCMHLALGESNGEMKMYRNAASASSSLLPLAKRHQQAFPNAEEGAREIVQIRSLDEVCAPLALYRGILLKMDAQGYELSILKGGKSVLPAVDTIIVEASFVSLYEGQPLFNDIYEFLYSRSFNYHGNLEKVLDPVSGEVLWEDAVFLRRSPEETPR